jgi:hypothetical protein
MCPSAVGGHKSCIFLYDIRRRKHSCGYDICLLIQTFIVSSVNSAPDWKTLYLLKLGLEASSSILNAPRGTRDRDKLMPLNAHRAQRYTRQRQTDATQSKIVPSSLLDCGIQIIMSAFNYFCFCSGCC